MLTLVGFPNDPRGRSYRLVSYKFYLNASVPTRLLRVCLAKWAEAEAGAGAGDETGARTYI